MRSYVLVTILAAAHAAGGSSHCEDLGSCEAHGGDETSLLARHVPQQPLAVPVQEKLNTGCTKIGTLSLHGYYWPTQPGDANDLRTFCRVKPENVDDFNYSCQLPYQEDEYGSVIATVENFTFAVAQKQHKEGMKEAFGNAVKYFLEDPDVCAIICNVGFCAAYQALTEEAITEIIAENPRLVRKPMLLGSPILALEYLPTMLPTLTTTPVKALRAPDEVIIIITASYPSLADDLVPLFDTIVNGTIMLDTSRPSRPNISGMDDTIREFLQAKAGLDCAEGMSLVCMTMLERMHGGMLPRHHLIAKMKAQMAAFRKRIYVIGWNEMPGYKPVDLGGAFHNAKLTSDNYRTYKYGGLDHIMRKIGKLGQKVVGVVVESTEQATNSNDIRIDLGLPVWDFSTMGICLGAASKGDYNASDPHIINAVFNSKSFRDCLLRWAAPGKVEPKFGKQPDGTFLFYENLTLPEILTLTCVGGRPDGHPPIGRLMKHFDTGVPHHTPTAEVCHMTELCKCNHDIMMLTAPCLEACPGSGNCGGGSPPYPCGTDGRNCSTLADVPEIAGKCYTLGFASKFGPAAGKDRLHIEGTT